MQIHACEYKYRFEFNLNADNLQNYKNPFYDLADCRRKHSSGAGDKIYTNALLHHIAMSCQKESLVTERVN